jgi:hypothetical protein
MGKNHRSFFARIALVASVALTRRGFANPAADSKAGEDSVFLRGTP